ncbi:MAG: hypothetical protein SFW09_06745 [Hyphomicrobiaceae bacterium]|nr:hypothetical protein [Hyphomicrobiaceae bacterium]
MSYTVRYAHSGLSLSVMAVLLAGCSATSELLSGSFAPETQQPKMRATRSVAMVSLQPIIGPPPAVAEQIVKMLDASAQREQIALVVDPAVKSPTALTGYMVTQGDGKTAKLSFVWDVLGADGTRIERLTGEEVFPTGTASPDIWASLPPSTLQSMADKVVGALAPKATR